MKRLLVKIVSKALGDTIAAMPVIEKYAETYDGEVYVSCNPSFSSLFIKSYPTLKFQTSDVYDSTITVYFKKYDVPVQTGCALEMGFADWKYVRPKVDIPVRERPINSKYVCISVHSTSQLKYWNHPHGKRDQPKSTNWDSLCRMLRKAGLTPVVLDKYDTFGVAPYFNGLPKAANKKINIPLNDVLNYLHHCEFFIGLSSGGSWLAHAAGKPVAMICNFSDLHNEFDVNLEDYIKITNDSVCNGCWGKHTFDETDWYWCPLHKGTNRQFECHTSITPEFVFSKIQKWI